MTNQRFLLLPIHEPFELGAHFFVPDGPVMSKGATLEFDLVKDTVKLPGGFVCSLANLAHVVGKALMAQEKLNCDHCSPWVGNIWSLKERGKKGPYL